MILLNRLKYLKKKQYESVASKPMEEFKVKEDFFIENVGNTPDQTNDQLKHALLT